MMDKIKTAASLFESPKASSTRTGSSSHRHSQGSGYDRYASGRKGSKGLGKNSKSKSGSSPKSSVSDPTVNVMDAFADLVNNMKDKKSFKHAIKQIFNSRAKEGDRKSDHFHQKYEMVKMKTHDEDDNDDKKPKKKKKSKDKHGDEHDDKQEDKRSVTLDEEMFTFDSRDMPMGAIPELQLRFAEADPYPEADAYADPEAEAFPSASAYAPDPLTSVVARRALLKRALSLKEDFEFERREVEEEEDEDEEESNEHGKKASGKHRHSVDNEEDDDEERPRKHTAGEKGGVDEEKLHTTVKEKVLTGKPMKFRKTGSRVHSDDMENGGHSEKKSKSKSAAKNDDDGDGEEKPTKSSSGKAKESFEDDDWEDEEDEEADVADNEHESLRQKPKESSKSKHGKPSHQHKQKPSRLHHYQQHHSNKLHFDRYGRPHYVPNDAKFQKKPQAFQKPAQEPTRQESNGQFGPPNGKPIKLVSQTQNTPFNPPSFFSQQQQAKIGVGKQGAALAQVPNPPSTQRAQPNQQPGTPAPSCNRQACDGCRRTPGILCTNECKAC